MMANAAPKKFRVPHGFWPRPYQKRFMRFMDQGGRRACWVVHRRGGKDLTALHQTAKLALQRVGMYWHIFPTAEQGRKAIWTGFTREGRRIMEQVFPREIRKSPKDFSTNGEMVVELKNGSIWRLMGSDKLEVVGAGPIGVVFSEYALAKPKTWNLVRPMLAENGGWAVFISTPRGKNHFFELYRMALKNPRWFCELQTLYDTRAYDPEGTIAEERESGMPEALIRQEYLCDFTVALVGAIFGELLDDMEQAGRIAAFDATTAEVHTSWDLGRTDSTSIWWWAINPATRGIEVVDHYSSHGRAMPHYISVVKERAEERGWKYGTHWLPHDAKAKTLAASTSIQEQAQAGLGAKHVAIVPKLDLLDGIQATRALLLDPRTRLHTGCGDGLESLKAYRYEYDEDAKTFSTRPVHDWASHDADAFRGIGVVAKVQELVTRPKPKAEAPKPRTINSFTMDELWATRRRG